RNSASSTSSVPLATPASVPSTKRKILSPTSPRIATAIMTSSNVNAAALLGFVREGIKMKVAGGFPVRAGPDRFEVHPVKTGELIAILVGKVERRAPLVESDALVAAFEFVAARSPNNGNRLAAN